MKAVIMCAGKGTRMLPKTRTTHKVLLPVAGKPFLYYLMYNMKKAGYDDIALIVGHLREQFPEFLSKYKLKAELIVQEEQLGTGHALLQAEAFAENENIVVIGGDTLVGSDDLQQIAVDDGMCYLVGRRHQNPEQFGVLVTDGEFLVDMPEKPKEFITDMINIGIYKFTPSIFTALKQVKKSPRGEYEINDAIKILAKKRNVKVRILRGYWKDFGSLADIPDVEDFLEEHHEEFE